MNREEPVISEADIDQFIEVTGVDRDRARFYLDTAAGNLPLAISGFFEGGFADEGGPEIIYDRQGSDDDIQIIEEPLIQEPDEESVSVEDEPSPSTTKQNRNVTMSDKKVATLFSSKKDKGANRDSGQSDDDDEERRGQAFYVGGSEKSGQQVLGPPKKKPADDLAERLFKQAREHGAEAIDPSQRAGAGSSTTGSTFKGAGYKLGDTVQPTHKIGGENEAAAEMDGGNETATVVMRMYQNGFTLDDGPLRTLDLPADRQFLDQIMQGRLPVELVQAHRGKHVDLEMEDHRNEEYKPPKASLKPFTGQGRTLGTPLPTVVGAGMSNSNKSGGASAAATAKAVNVEPIKIDDSKPVTNISVRLASGEKITLKMNHDHTIQDLRQSICSMRPDMANRPFMLMTTFPNKELTDENITLKDANLVNAVVTQRFR